MNEIAAQSPGEILPLSAISLMTDLRAAVLAGRSANTLRAYASDLDDFARFMRIPTAAAALDGLTSFAAPMANACVMAYRSHLVDRRLSASTIGRRLAALRTACRVARQLGRIDWGLEVESPRAEAYRDTSGPGRDGFRAILDQAKAGASSPRGRRDLALIRLLHDVALRRAEAIGLDLIDVDLTRGTIQVQGKGHSTRAPITLPAPTRGSLADWIAARGTDPGPLFTRLDRAGSGRLTGESVRRIVRDLGRAAKLSRVVRPHGLRHQGITRALDATGGDVRAVRKFSRHVKLETLATYDDNRTDLAGGVAALVAED